VVLLPGPEHVVVGPLVLLPRFPCPLVVVVVVWLFELLPTFSVPVVMHVFVPLSLVYVPAHCSEGETASAAVGPKASREAAVSINAANTRGMIADSGEVAR
jgi:hypothetical protein